MSLSSWVVNVNHARADTIFATLKAIVDDETSTIYIVDDIVTCVVRVELQPEP